MAHSLTYGEGGFDPDATNNNVVEVTEVDEDGQVVEVITDEAGIAAVI